MPRLYFGAVWLFFKGIGAGIFQARMLSLLSALLVLYLVHRCGEALADGWAGLGASVLLGSSFAFSWQSHVARPEMLTMAFLVGAFLLLSQARRGGGGSGRRLFLASLTAALTVNVHPNNIQFMPAFLVIFPVIFGRRAFGKPGLYYLGGFGAAFALWLLAVYVPSREVSAGGGVSGLYMFKFLKEGPFGIALEGIARFHKDYVLDYLALFQRHFPSRISVYYFAGLLGAIILAGLFTANRAPILQSLFFVFLGAYGNYFVISRLGYWHAIEFYPWLALAGGLGLRGLWQLAGERLKDGGFLPVRAMRVAVSLAAAALVLPSVADTASVARGMRAYNYAKVIESVAAAIPLDGRAVGTSFYTPAFEGRDFVPAWFDIETGSLCQPFEEKLGDEGIRYVIFDDVFRRLAALDCGEAYAGDAARFLFLKGTLVAVIREPYPSYWAEDGIVDDVYVFKAN
jgi:hypothetical protein